MDTKPAFVLPSETEKLSHKFLLDAIRTRRATEVAVEPPHAPHYCGTATEPAAPAGEESFREPPAPTAVSDIELPEGRKYFRIGEVADLIGVEQHVLRYWETEFTMIRPSKSGGQRVYRRRDVETLHLIRHLLHVEKFSIRGARKKVLEHRRARQHAPVAAQAATPPAIGSTASPAVNRELLREIAGELKELVRLAQQS